MTTHGAVVLVRGINVGSSRKVPMADLRALATDIGAVDVATYIQSGNVVLSTELADDKLAEAFERGIESTFGFRPKVLVRRPEDLRRILDTQPFGADAQEFMHVGFLDAEPSPDAVAALDRIDFAPEQFAVAGRELYLYLPLGMGRSPLMAKVPFERRLGVDITVRNWRTVTKLADLVANRP